MKKIIEWIKSSKSDFVLFLLLIVLVNIAGHKAFVRFDLTEPKSYSLSKASKTLVKNLEEPLSIRVFFDDNLPNQYSQVYQYVKDIMVEYKGAANKKFSVSYMDMSKPENVELARNLGVQQIQIQEVKNNEVGFKQGFMGLVITYGDSIEVLNPITSTDGFEYKITSKMSKMIAMADTLNGLKADDKIMLTLYLSNDLKSLGISGAAEAEDIVKKAFNSVNKKNMDRLEFRVVSPNTVETDILSNKYGIQAVSYSNAGIQSKAAIGLVLEHGEKFYALPLEIQRSLFGYAIGGLDEVEKSIGEGLESLLSNVKSIGYITGHQELTHDSEETAGNLEQLISGMYELVDIDLSTANIPAGMNSVIINGPQFGYTEEELYKLDQFVMRGGNIIMFIDGVHDDGANRQYNMANYVPNDSNLDRLLEKYGVTRGKNMVMDKNCYKTSNAQYGEMNLYWAPVLHKKDLAKKNVITNNLGYVVALQQSSLDVTLPEDNKDVKATVLAKSSDEAWTMDRGIVLHPMYIDPPADKDAYKSYNLAVMLEGKFNSAFDSAPVKENDENADNSLVTSNHISSSLMPGKVFVMGSSAVTTYQVISADGSSPVSMFIMNVIDYMNGHEDLCSMRTKILAVNNLTIKTPAAANFWKFFEQYGLVVILAIVGFIVWRMRTNRRKAINKKYNPNDTRTIK